MDAGGFAYLMPVKKHKGKVVRVRTKRLSDGTLLRVYVFSKKGPRGGRTVGEKVRKPRGKTK